jgi:glutamate--cysteine ligase
MRRFPCFRSAVTGRRRSGSTARAWGGSQPGTARVPDRDVAEQYVAQVSFRPGQPSQYGLELEWTVHHADDRTRRTDLRALGRALGAHAPSALAHLYPSAQALPLPGGALVTVEPGGQAEISTAVHRSPSALLSSALGDIAALDMLLATQGLVRGDRAMDEYRAPARLLDTPRYGAMQRAFDNLGTAGSEMMCRCASIQVSLDAGEPGRIGPRWSAVNGLGPVMLALFANSPAMSSDGRHWASSRMRAVLDTDHGRSLPLPPTSDPAREWATKVLDTALLCVRRPGMPWDAPPGVTFADWVEGRTDCRLGSGPATFGDLDYHLSTLFPPVRPRGYLEVRYLDAQPGNSWVTPVALMFALMQDERTVDSVNDVTRPDAGLWFEAARLGLEHPVIAAQARRILALGEAALHSLDLSPDLFTQVETDLHRLRARLGDR